MFVALRLVVVTFVNTPVEAVDPPMAVLLMVPPVIVTLDEVRFVMFPVTAVTVPEA